MIYIVGHTDPTGKPDDNEDLSRRRAEKIKQIFVERHNLREDHLIVVPMGQGYPETDNATARGRAQNRRVDFIFVYNRRDRAAQVKVATNSR